MSREFLIPIPDQDIDVIRHIEPARLLDQSLAALQHRINGIRADNSTVLSEGAMNGLRTIERVHRDLKAVRNAWVLILGTARLQCLGDD